MITRVSTKSTLRTYQSNLQRSTLTLDNSMNTVLNNRQFNTFSDNPAKATQSFRVHASYARVESQRQSNESAIYKMEAASSSMHNFSEQYSNALDAAERGMNDPTASGRRAVGQTLIGAAQNMVKTLNAKYGDKFVFAGADGLNAPFELVETKEVESTASLFRAGAITFGDNAVAGTQAASVTYQIPNEDGTSQVFSVDVRFQVTVPTPPDAEPSAAIETTLNSLKSALDEAQATDATGAQVKLSDLFDVSVSDGAISLVSKEQGKMAPAVTKLTLGNQDKGISSNDIDQKDGTEKVVGTKHELFYRGKSVDDPENAEILKKMSEETTYIDIGLGMQMDENDQIIPSTAFNSAVSGLALLGYGTVNGEAGGVPNNTISLVAAMGDLFMNEVDTDTGKFTGSAQTRANALFDNFQKSFAEVNTNWGEVETRAEFLKTNDSRLEDTSYTLTEEYEGLDMVDMADALTTFAYAQYSYNAALRVGNQILSQSFIDFMN